jgi:hypothetical protein
VAHREGSEHRRRSDEVAVGRGGAGVGPPAATGPSTSISTAARSFPPPMELPGVAQRWRLRRTLRREKIREG